MREVLTQSLGPGIALFVAIAMFNLGLDLTIRQITEPLRNRRLLVSSLVANIILVPMIAFGLTSGISLDETAKIGILLYACCAGSEAAPKFVQVANGNAAFAVALLGILLPVTVIGVPMVLSLGLPGVHVEQGKVLLKLLVVVALPMTLGLVIRARFEAIAARLSKVIHRIAMIFLCLLLAQIIYVHFDKFAALQGNVLIVGLLFFAAAFVVGYLLGGPESKNRRALAIMTFVRAGSISMMIAGQVFARDEGVLVMATVMTSASVVFCVLASMVLRRIPV